MDKKYIFNKVIFSLRINESETAGLISYLSYITICANEFNVIHDYASMLVYSIRKEQMEFILMIREDKQSERSRLLNELKQQLAECISCGEMSSGEPQDLVRIQLIEVLAEEDCNEILYSSSEKESSSVDRDTVNRFLGLIDRESKHTPDERQSEDFIKRIVSIDKLVGLKDLKKEVRSLVRFAELNSKTKGSQLKRRSLPLHYIFTIEDGMGLTTILRNFSQVLYNLGITGASKFGEYEGVLNFDINRNPGLIGVFKKDEAGGITVNSGYGVVAINLSRQLEDSSFKFQKLMKLMWDERGKVVFILIIHEKDESKRDSLIRKVQENVNFHHIHFPPYSDDELIDIARAMLKKSGFEIDRGAEKYLLERINEEKEEGNFKNLKTVRKIIDEAWVEKILNSENDSDVTRLDTEDFEPDDDDNRNISDYWIQLDSMIGLEKIKKRIREIASAAKVDKTLRDMGIKTSEMCYHMMFTGNPGTGKTTVARIIGGIFKDIGILSKGELYEVSRDSMVAQFVGQTAPLVREKVREALGSVLFIDEAYSIYGGPDRRDFGYEAISTLVKEMENNRDNLIVILAGYTDEMEELLEMNSGLRERIPYKIEFPDYTEEELTRIFMKILGDEYVLENGVLERVSRLFKDIHDGSSEDFANGRLARNLVERLKIKQSARICREELFSREEMLTVKLADIEEVCREEDILWAIGDTKEEKRGIGFRVNS